MRTGNRGDLAQARLIQKTQRKRQGSAREKVRCVTTTAGTFLNNVLRTTFPNACCCHGDNTLAFVSTFRADVRDRVCCFAPALWFLLVVADDDQHNALAAQPDVQGGEAAPIACVVRPTRHNAEVTWVSTLVLVAPDLSWLLLLGLVRKRQSCRPRGPLRPSPDQLHGGVQRNVTCLE